jgi:hypothetical protein
VKPLVIFHGRCPDGWGAAWWLGRALGDHDKHEGMYGDPPPLELADRDVYLVDFCYPAADLDAIAGQCRSLLILDHHQTSVGYVRDSVVSEVTMLRAIDFRAAAVRAVLNMEHSGVGLVGDYVNGRFGFEAPLWFENIEDRDLWRFVLPETAEVFAAVTSRPYTVEAWDEMERMLRIDLVGEGRAIDRYRRQLIDATVATAFRTTVLGHEVWCAASPYAIGSDVAGELALRDPGLFAAYYVDYGDRRRYGLRSTRDGVDVAALAETVGGGGHQHAAGFEVAQWTGR